MKNYRAALQYYRDNGNLDVPSSYVSEDGVALGQWIFSMRTARRSMGKERGTRRIDERQIGMLDEIGMIWERKADLKWEAAYAKAARYRTEFGDLKVPATYRTEDGFHLGKWIYRQRTAGRDRQDDGKRRGKRLTEEQIRRLDEIGMVW